MQKLPLRVGKQIVLRPLSLRDAPRFCDWLADPEVASLIHNTGTPPPSLEDERTWIEESRAKKDEAVFSVDTAEGTHIGSCGLMKIDTHNRNAHLGIMIGDKKCWGQGLGTEAVQLLVRYGFNRLRLHRIALRVFAYNIRAIKSYEKAGFVREGTLRQSFYRNRLYQDEVVMSILKSET